MIRFLIAFVVIVLLLGLSLFFVPIDTLLKRVNTSSALSYSLAEGNLFNGRINDVSYKTSEDAVPLDLGDYFYDGNIQFTGIKVTFNNEDSSTLGVVKTNFFNGNLYLEDFSTKTEYKTNGLGMLGLKVKIDKLTIIDGLCSSITGTLSLSNDSFNEVVKGDIKCLENNIYEADLFNSNNVEMGTIIYRPGFIDLEIETAILKADVSVFLGKRMGFTIPL
tara:strand:+ start:205 stop:864 length:660 start_codon:yes stop_codon:yes gene_type:complete